jgi:hypothetical protein
MQRFCDRSCLLFWRVYPEISARYRRC